MLRNTKLCKGIVSLALFGLMCLTGCKNNALEGSDLNLLSSGETYEKEELSEYSEINDKNSLYEDQDEIKVLYITVGKGSDSDSTNHTFEELNYIGLKENSKGNKTVKCEALLQFGNEEGPVMGMYGYGVTAANATIQLSGTKSAQRQQKSYRLDLKSGNGSIDDMKSVVLSKSFTDPLRITNKLCYELMQEVPALLSTRTYFTHVYIKDVTEGKDTKFVDYGLYTMVEPINKKYLSNRGIDKSGELFKAVDFDWKRHEDVIVQPTDANYNKLSFEELLVSKGSNDYSTLIEMLEAVNDESIPIKDTIKKYFDENNLYSWMAFNILINNKDIAKQNYYIYSPTGVDTFYFISWDNDGALRDDYEYMMDSEYDPGWKQGAHIYHDSIFFERILNDEYCVNKLSEAVENLHEGALSPENVTNKATELSELAKEYIYALPDKSFARVTGEKYDILISKLANQLDENFYTYYDSIEGPWPFHMLEPSINNGEVTVSWEESSAVNMGVTYELQIDDSWDFSSPIVEKKGLTDTSYDVGKLDYGQYFMRVTAVSDNDHTTGAMDYYNTEKKTRIYNALCFYVFDDGSIDETTFE